MDQAVSRLANAEQPGCPRPTCDSLHGEQHPTPPARTCSSSSRVPQHHSCAHSTQPHRPLVRPLLNLSSQLHGRTPQDTAQRTAALCSQPPAPGVVLPGYARALRGQLRSLGGAQRWGHHDGRVHQRRAAVRLHWQRSLAGQLQHHLQAPGRQHLCRQQLSARSTNRQAGALRGGGGGGGLQPGPVAVALKYEHNMAALLASQRVMA